MSGAPAPTGRTSSTCSPGAWNVVVLTAGGAKAERAVDIPAGDAVRLDIEMEPAA